MKNSKLYNLMFPTVLLFYISPVLIFASIIGNFFVDFTILLMISLVLFKKIDKDFLKESFLKVYFLGFLADIIGAIYLCVIGLGPYAEYYEGTNFWKNVLSDIHIAIQVDPFRSVYGFIFIISGIVISGFLIYILNYIITFKGTYWLTKKQRMLAALLLSLFTAPYTFLIPTKLFF